MKSEIGEVNVKELKLEYENKINRLFESNKQLLKIIEDMKTKYETMFDYFKKNMALESYIVYSRPLTEKYQNKIDKLDVEKKEKTIEMYKNEINELYKIINYKEIINDNLINENIKKNINGDMRISKLFTDYKKLIYKIQQLSIQIEKKLKDNNVNINIDYDDFNYFLIKILIVNPYKELRNTNNVFEFNENEFKKSIINKIKEKYTVDIDNLSLEVNEYINFVNYMKELEDDKMNGKIFFIDPSLPNNVYYDTNEHHTDTELRLKRTIIPGIKIGSYVVYKSLVELNFSKQLKNINDY